MNTRAIFANLRNSEKPIEISDVSLDACLYITPLSQVHRGYFRGEMVAIKTMECEVDEEAEDEILTYHTLSHLSYASAYIVTLFGYHLPQFGYRLIMRYASLGTLGNFLRHPDNQNLPLFIQEHLIKRTTFALAWLQSHGFIHRDLTSNNILLTEDLTPLICDFADAKFVTGPIRENKRIGTPAWMAPEVITSHIFSFASDMYSLAIIHWEVMSQCLPYKDVDDKVPLSVFFQRIKQGERPAINLSWKEGIIKLLTEGFSENPAERPDAKTLVKRWDPRITFIKGEKISEEIDDALIPSLSEQCTCRIM